MVDWELIARSGGRYSVAYGGGTALLVALTGWSMLQLLVLVFGLLLLLFVAGGTGTVRMGTAMANADSPGLSGTVTDPTEDDAFATAIDADLKLFFYAVGLLVFDFAAMVVGSTV
ncbi:hypothetical protein M0R88_12265 [Halorussus gelatinilyticus]|uniref:DUF8070 domain-containing protein n=1 Tax=Halorussus gelatinilyticus TaxID=2937524 RepID=A0A8U0IE07_9EURY|nr:hypothetical protein [Halorussus gelatinilyticus]UPV99296.1 hypothetical protein M0R88_12265 [Halorussus gelatinilyticus]